MGKRSPTALAAMLAFLAVACSGGSSPKATTPAARRSPADPFAQTITNGAACPVSQRTPLPAGSGCTSDARGDLDGDGTVDRFVVFATLDAQHKPVSWHAIALLGDGSATPIARIPFGAEVEGQPDLYPVALGSHDADGDGRAEVFVKLTGVVYHIAVSHIVGMFRVADGRIEQVEIEGAHGPEPWHFFTGGTSRRGQAVVCAEVNGEPVLLERLIEVVPPERWRWSEQTLVWRVGVLVPNGKPRLGYYPPSVSIADPRVVAFFKLRCGPVVLE